MANDLPAEKVYVHRATKHICVTRAELDTTHCIVEEGQPHKIKKFYRQAGYKSIPVARFKTLLKGRA